MAKRSQRGELASRFLPGDIYSFRTPPLGSSQTDERPRYGAFRVHEVGADRQFPTMPPQVTVVLLDGVFDEPPTMAEVIELPLLLRTADPLMAGKAEIVCVPIGVDPDPDLLLFRLGTVDQHGIELPLFPRAYAPSWQFVCIGLKVEWRWRNDRDRFLAERREAIAKYAADAAAAEQRRRTRLKGLTLEMLLAETHFERWQQSPPFPPAAFTEAARGTINRTIRAIVALGQKPRKAAVRNLLCDCVQWFNEEASSAGDAIETEEREDVMQLLADICFVARHPSLVDEIDEWRTW